MCKKILISETSMCKTYKKGDALIIESKVSIEEHVLGRCLCGCWDRTKDGICKHCADKMGKAMRKLGRETREFKEKQALKIIAEKNE